MNEIREILYLIRADFCEWAEWLNVPQNFRGMIKLIVSSQKMAID